MKEIYFSNKLTNMKKNDLNIELSKKFLKKEKFFLKLIFFKIYNNYSNIGTLIFDIKDLLLTLSLNTKHELVLFLDSIASKNILYKITNEKKNFEGAFSILSSFILIDDNVRVFLTEEFKLCFSKANNLFSNFEMEKYIFMEDFTSFNFYSNLLKNLKDTGEFEITPSELREAIKLSTKYERFYDFEKNILKKIIFDVNNFSEFKIYYKKIKLSSKATNKIITLKFFYKKESLETRINDPQITKLMNMISSHLKNHEQIHKLISLYVIKKDYDYVSNNIIYTKENFTNDFDQLLTKSLLYDLASYDFEEFINIKKIYKDPTVLFNDFFNTINKIRNFEPYLENLYQNRYTHELKKMMSFKSDQEIKFTNDKLDVYVKYRKYDESVIRISLEKKTIKKINKGNKKVDN